MLFLDSSGIEYRVQGTEYRVQSTGSRVTGFGNGKGHGDPSFLLTTEPSAYVRLRPTLSGLRRDKTAWQAQGTKELGINNLILTRIFFVSWCLGGSFFCRRGS